MNTTKGSTRIVLGYTSALEFANRIFLDLSKREKPVLPLVRKTISSPFFEDFEVLTFQLEELLAEKLRVAVQRKKPRDYLDIYYIAESGNADFTKAAGIAKKKLSAYKEKLDKSRILEDTELVQALWEQDLKEVLPRIPDFGEVLNTIKKVFTT